MIFFKEHEKRMEEVDNYLREVIKPQYPEIIYESIEYSLFGSGKKVRSMLLLGACEAFMGSYEKAIPFAAAVECIQTYSLIHDDLPAIDNDDLRRGKPSNHKKFGEDIAILTGDALLNLAYEIMLLNCTGYDVDQKLKAMREISTSCGIYGMIGGQVADVISKGYEIDEEALMYIHNHKTSAFITSSLVAGGYLGDAHRNYITHLKTMGSYLGLAFQIKDDLLDITSTPEKLGKNVGSDARNKVQTYVEIFGIETSEKHYKEISKKAIDLMKELPIKSGFLNHLVENIMDRDF